MIIKSHLRNLKSNFFRILDTFFCSSQASGVILIVCTVIAMLLSNMPSTAAWYKGVLNARFSLTFVGSIVDITFLEVVNDALMAIFFFSVGLEIKREYTHGHLSTWKQASLPVFAALGGMVFPALIYSLFNAGTPTSCGWGIPMATDIAFSLGILSMFSRKVPISLKVFLTTLAVADDLGSILVIAIFYSGKINFMILGIAAIAFAFLVCLNLCNVYKIKWYIVPAILLWILFMNSGVHATIAGVLIAFTIPSDSMFKRSQFVPKASELLTKFAESTKGEGEIIHKGTHMVLQNLRYLTRNTIPPVQRLEFALQETVNFVIMPLFALVNAGVVISGTNFADFFSLESAGIVLGLLCGKPLGIVLTSYLVIKAGISSMPEGASLKSYIGVGLLGGIGFTMSIFVDTLAFVNNPDFADIGKLAILIGSTLSAVVGALVLTSLKDIDRKFHW